jgi:hypothetical protein
MSNRKFDKITVADVTVVKSTDKALLVEVDGSEAWVPKSQLQQGGTITEDSEEGAAGTLVVPRWLAEEKEFEGEENDEA